MRRVTVLLLLAALLCVSGAIGATVMAQAGSASPAPGATPSAGPVAPVSGDPRSEGEGPGLVGSPIAVLLGVVLLGLATALVTIVLVRWRGRPPD